MRPTGLPRAKVDDLDTCLEGTCFPYGLALFSLLAATNIGSAVLSMLN